MRTHLIAVACGCLVDVVGSLTIEVYGQVGIALSVARAAVANLAEVDRLLREFSGEIPLGAGAVDPQLRRVLTSVIGELTMAINEGTGIESDLVMRCCLELAEAHSMLKALEGELAAIPSPRVSEVVPALHARGTGIRLASARPRGVLALQGHQVLGISRRK